MKIIKKIIIIFLLLSILHGGLSAQVSSPGVDIGENGIVFRQASLDPSASSLASELKAYWKMDAASGTNEPDSKSSTTLAQNNTVGSTTGKIGTARLFVRSSVQYLSAADNADIALGDFDWTIAGWFKLTNKSNAKTFLSKRDGGTAGTQEFTFVYDSTPDRLLFILWNNSTTNNSVSADNFGSPALDTWYFVVIYHDNTNNRIGIRVNNGTANTTTLTVTPWAGTAGFKCGCQLTSPTVCLDGAIDELGKWNRLLTDAEQTYLYNSGAGRTYSGGILQ